VSYRYTTTVDGRGYTFKDRVLEKLCDWMFFPWGPLLVLFAFTLWAVSVGAEAEKKKRDDWMAECRADGKKNYECVAMWRAGEKHTEVVPVFIPSGGR